MTRSFENKVVVVTGGTSGIGLATAKAFIEAGASVFITGRRQDALDAAVKAIGGRITGVRGDMANLAMPGAPMLRMKKSGHMEKKDRNKKKKRR